jgi:hypothetical protein
MRESGFSLLSGTHTFALRLQPSELLWRENSLSATQKCLAAFLRASALHAFGLPLLDLRLLIGLKIQRSQIDAGRGVRIGRAFGTTCLVSCKRAGRGEHRSSNERGSDNLAHCKQ